MEEISVYDVKQSNLRDHINKFVYNHGVDKEFNYIEKRTEKDILHGDFKTALKEENKMKNRYSNVLPPEQYRVTLSVENEQDENSDYINASYICDLNGKEKRYICTQGPLESTFIDFWRMVWEVNSSIIVMLTREEENSKKKCDKYWVDKDSHDYGFIRLTYEAHITLQDMIQRIFTIEHIKTGEKRKLVHFQYISWPDHGTPVSIKGFLNLIGAVDKEDKSGQPIIVHCSAGIGRSGTFCVIHSVVTNFKYLEPSKYDQVTLNIPKIITAFRTQRPGMVQTKEQYRFCYSAIAESFTNQGKARKERSLAYSIN